MRHPATSGCACSRTRCRTPAAPSRWTRAPAQVSGSGRACRCPDGRPDAVRSAAMAEAAAPTLTALVVDDEAPALSELAYLLGRDGRIGTVRTAASGPEALRALEDGGTDVVFCDIKMPGMDGLDLARVLARFAEPPQVVFVTAYDDHAVDAFDLHATDYVMKPVRAERLGEAVRRVVDAVHGPRAPPPRHPHRR